MIHHGEGGPRPPAEIGPADGVGAASRLVGGGLALSASLAFVAAVGLGSSVGDAPGAGAAALRFGGVLLAALALGLLACQPRRSVMPATVALTGLIVAAAGLASDHGDAPLYAASYVALLAAGSSLVPAVFDSLVLASLPGTLAGFERVPTIDSVGRRELIRARRTERPLTVASVAIDAARRAELVQIARRALATVRETDVIGYAGAHRFFLIFVETPRGRAIEAWERVGAELGPDLTSRMRAGFASFPEDNPTWEGLSCLAVERSTAPALFAADGQPTALSAATVPNEA